MTLNDTLHIENYGESRATPRNQMRGKRFKVPRRWGEASQCWS